jgi:hypothetical protein
MTIKVNNTSRKIETCKKTRDKLDKKEHKRVPYLFYHLPLLCFNCKSLLSILNQSLKFSQYKLYLVMFKALSRVRLAKGVP